MQYKTPPLDSKAASTPAQPMAPPPVQNVAPPRAAPPAAHMEQTPPGPHRNALPQHAMHPRGKARGFGK